MTTSNGPLRTGTAKVEQIPVSWASPEHVTRERRLVIWLASDPASTARHL